MNSKFTDALDDNLEPTPGALVFGSSGALVPRRDVIKREADGSLTYKRSVMTPVGLVMPDDVTDDELVELGEILRGMENSVQWLLGDWLNRAERVWGTVYKDVPEYSYQTLRDYAYVARHVELSIRNRQLSFAHHRLVAALPPDDQQAWLDYAAQNNLSIADLRKAMKGTPKTDETTGAVEKQARTWSADVTKLARRIDQLDAKDRQRVRARAEWLADYYLRIAEKAR
jgi:hypothetical protein